jgi:electron transport complex protein RnfG
MAKLKSGFINMWLSLAGISLFAAAALGAVYSLTREPIMASKTAEQQQAVSDVLPPFQRLGEPETIEIPDIGAFEVYRAYDGEDQYVGAAVKSFSRNGFGGEIRIMVGFDSQCLITGYAILEQKETPGLGTRITDWFKPAVQTRKSLFEQITGYEETRGQRQSSITGKGASPQALTVTQDGGEIDAITAATISSRAFLEAVRNACAACAGNLDAFDADSGASPQTGEIYLSKTTSYAEQ